MILITGATGVLGSHVLYELANAGKPVKAIFRDQSAIGKTKKIFELYDTDASRLINQIEWIRADVCDFYAVSEALKDVSQVFHVAGFVSFNDRDKKKLNRSNITGTANVVNACLEAGNVSLCHVSSIATLGEIENGEPVTEEIIWNRGSSASSYAISKHKGEMEVWRGMNEGLNAVIVNPSVIIGPGMWTGPGKDLFNRVRNGLRFYPDGSTGYVDVRDVAKIMIILADRKIYGERFILNSGNLTSKEFLNLFAQKFGREGPSVRISPLIAGVAMAAELLRALFTASHPRIGRRTLKIASEKLSYSNQKITELLGVEFIPVEKSLNDAITLYKKLF